MIKGFLSLKIETGIKIEVIIAIAIKIFVRFKSNANAVIIPANPYVIKYKLAPMYVDGRIKTFANTQPITKIKTDLFNDRNGSKTIGKESTMSKKASFTLSVFPTKQPK